MRDGQEITIFEEGEPVMDGEPGDLKILIRTRPHPVFRRDGLDLHVTYTITLLDALNGFTKSLTHLDGHQVTLASGGVIRPGEVRTIRGEGMPHFDHPQRKGNLHVTFLVAFPQQMGEAARAGVREALRDAAYFAVGTGNP